MTKHLPEKKRRQDILDAARRLFVEQGYGPTKMSDIAAAAGLSKGGVYFHFVSKEEVFEALVEAEYDRSMGAIKALIESSDSFGPELLSTMANHFFEKFQTQSDGARFFIVMGEMALRNEHLRKKLNEIQRKYWEVMAELLRRGIEGGVIRSDLDPQSGGIILKAVIDGIEAIAALDRNAEMQTLNFQGMLDVVLKGLLQPAVEKSQPRALGTDKAANDKPANNKPVSAATDKAPARRAARA